MKLHDLADELLEIRRYVRKNPEHVRERLTPLRSARWLEDWDDDVRLDENMRVGLSRIIVDPEILEGYLYGAAAEIRELAIKQEDAK